MAGREQKPATRPSVARKSRRDKTVTAVLRGTRGEQQRDGDKRTEFQRLRDQAAIARLYMRGWMQKDIAIELNLSESTISRDLSAIIEALEASAKEDLKVAKARELAKINHLEKEAWEAWEQSKQPKRSTVKSGGEGQTARAQIKEQQRDGDPRYMQVIQWCIEMRSKILGILAPVKLSSTNPMGDESAPMYSVMPVPVDYRKAIGPLRPSDGEGGDE